MKNAEARADARVVVDIRSRTHARLSDPNTLFSVECCKASGVWVPFGHYARLGEASAIRDRLAEVGCPSRVVEHRSQ
jgi:hypothetical protein